MKIYKESDELTICWLDSTGLVYPLYPFIFLPNAFPFTPIHPNNLPIPMPFAVDPLSDILSTIRPTISTCTMLLIQMVITFIHATILPLIPPIPMHLIVQPSSGILPPIRPHIQPITGDLIIFPISIILAAISPYILPFPTFLPQLVIPFIPATIHPCLHSIPML